MRQLYWALLVSAVLIACNSVKESANTLDSGSDTLGDLYYWFTKSCHGAETWYCHVECCNGFTDDTCIDDCSSNAFGECLEYAYGAAHQRCDHEAAAVCAGQQSLPSFAQACYFSGSKQCSGATVNVCTNTTWPAHVN